MEFNHMLGEKVAVRAQELCESGSNRPGLLLAVPNSPYSFRERKATLMTRRKIKPRQSSEAVWKSRWLSWAPSP